VRELERRGAVFVESEEEPAGGSLLVLSAHGVAPAVHERAAASRLRTIDAVCPLVTRVHTSVRKYATAGYTVLLVGHPDHEEVIGTRGEAPDRTIVVETIVDAEGVTVPDPSRVAYATPDHALGRRDPPRSWRSCGGGSRTSSGRTRATSATPPPTASRR
jgi:4-hydroxy-3-methylbut-2-enyl diphosphate reductase